MSFPVNFKGHELDGILCFIFYIYGIISQGLVAQLCPAACEAPLSMGFSRQEYWSGLPCPPPGHLPNPGMEPESPMSPAMQADSLPAEPLGRQIGRAHV